MKRRPAFAAALLAMLAGGPASASGQDGESAGWQIPAGAGREVNPVAVSDDVVSKGRDIYRSKCQRCHGPSGRGDGPDADSEHKPGNLSDMGRAARNPDGVMFYKIWNGRADPKMPAFKSELLRDEVWTVIHYVKTLRN